MNDWTKRRTVCPQSFSPPSDTCHARGRDRGMRHCIGGSDGEEGPEGDKAR